MTNSRTFEVCAVVVVITATKTGLARLDHLQLLDVEGQDRGESRETAEVGDDK
jgi:hypothetical protein